ncbi:hypothetical protein NDA01_29910 [Trichocoleus desertorum AS-A10]|uniref:hypothetical protein n=1 Tax=Trichocoleus desertorum TaxID=1481672 RepID=UPI003296C01E
MKNVTLLELYFLPPMAMARLGNSDTPLEAFAWEEDARIHSACRTVIRPRISFRVRSDGSLEPYLPEEIQFKDDGKIRPAAPFFELWADVLVDSQGFQQVPVTLDLLNSLGVSLEKHLLIHAHAANTKASRRVKDPSCSFAARVTIRGGDFSQHHLLASSPSFPERESLVYHDAPIPLGHVQLIRPVSENSMEQDLSVVRVRFTPAKGEVYGPANASAGSVSPLEPGRQLSYASIAARTHEIVPEQNRILNPNTPWSQYVMDTGKADDPQPSDSYDGANVGNSICWGVVDDTCEIVLKAELTVKGQRFTASTRAFVAPPDYAPDRRPFFSMADELADRELPPVEINDATAEVTAEEIHDLFKRIFETTNLLNLDASRDYLIRENLKRAPLDQWQSAPHIGREGMTRADKPLARLSSDILNDGLNGKPNVGHSRLPYTDLSEHAHGSFTSLDYLILFMKTRGDRLKQMIRPPFGSFAQLPVEPLAEPHPDFRDPRVFRDTLHDMRMPPYMRDSDREPLSLTRRQYTMLMDYLTFLQQQEASVQSHQSDS